MKVKIFLQFYWNQRYANEETPEEIEASIEAAASVVKLNTTSLPEGVIVVTMPRLSDTMEEGTVASWLKQVGDVIRRRRYFS